jgi:hypothetical protein
MWAPGDKRSSLEGVLLAGGLGHAFKRSHRIDLYGAWVKLGLDGITFRGQFGAVPADYSTLPSGAGLLAYAVPQAKRGAEWERTLASGWGTDVIANLIHT